MDSVLQITAALTLAVFYGCYFLKMLRQRRQGIRTDHMGEGKQGFVKFVEVSLKCVTIAVPMAEIISILCNTAPLPLPVRTAGCCLAIAGTAVFAVSVATMRDSWRAGVSREEKTELVTSGIYRISRNPAFLGFDLLYIGILMAFFNLPLCALSFAGMVLFHLQIVNVEEDFLLETFGDAYLDYRRQVCRYLGRKRR